MPSSGIVVYAKFSLGATCRTCPAGPAVPLHILKAACLCMLMAGLSLHHVLHALHRDRGTVWLHVKALHVLAGHTIVKCAEQE